MLKFGTGVSINDSEVSKVMKTANIVSTARQDFPAAANVTRPTSGSVWTSFERPISLEAELAATPDVRAAEVARGRLLVADPNYPSHTQLRKIARVLLDGGLKR